MREIKFRAYISPTTVIYFTLEDLVNPNPLFSIRELVIPWLREGNKPDDFTGLKDKNGKEIYEGDIVNQIDPDFPKPVTQTVRWNERGLNWTVWKPDLPKEVEVIGNIHENPELLEA